jgi:hypothetical protein
VDRNLLGLACGNEYSPFGGKVSDYISVDVVSVRRLLSGSYTFHLPWFQRAYAWHTGEVGRLLTNLLEVLRSDREPRRYFLGKLMLARPNGEPETALVDGHQRVMTLTLLYSVLRDLEPDEGRRDALHKYVANGHCHLRPQETLSEFALRYVQTPGATLVDPEADMAALSDTQRNIIENRDYLRAELGSRDIDVETRRALADFIGDRCFVMACAVDDEDEAWRILQIEEDTRLEFNPTDRAKASILSIVPAAEREPCQVMWQTCEALLGPADLYSLLLHMRTLRLRRLSDKPVETDLAKAYALNAMGVAFMEKDLVPAAQLTARIRSGVIGQRKDRAAIAGCIQQMTWVDANFWMPAAINWLSRRSENEPGTRTFFSKLERLIWMMRLSGLDPVKRQRHILRLLGEMDKGGSAESLRELEISKSMRDAALESLRSPTFDSKHYASKLLRRLSVALGQDPGPVHVEHVTLEHILPRSFLAQSAWRQQFPTGRSVQNFAHRLGNLTFLSAADNQAADTLDWTAKRRILSASKFVLSKQAGTARQWTGGDIQARTETLIAVLMKEWDIKI